jgi:NTP pyrophosphatase (non-canonical NTP hydrolase)
MATRLEHELTNWHERNYGHVDVPATYRKLLEEVGELGEALIIGNVQSIYEECGDVAILLFHVLRGSTREKHHQTLAGAMGWCLEKCLQREEEQAKRSAEANRLPENVEDTDPLMKERERLIQGMLDAFRKPDYIRCQVQLRKVLAATDDERCRIEAGPQ